MSAEIDDSQKQIQKFSIDDTIDKLFHSELELHPEELYRYVERLHENYQEALRSMNRRTYLLLFAWIAAMALGSGQVTEAEIGGIKISGVSTLLPAFPFAIGFIGYDLICAGSAVNLLWQAISRCYMNALPTAYKLNLEFLIAPPSFTNVERMYDGISRSNDVMGKFITWIFGTIVLLVPLVAIGHIAYLSWNVRCSKLFLCLSTALGFIMWVRSIILVLENSNKKASWVEQRIEVD